jgi:hypothetical protein
MLLYSQARSQHAFVLGMYLTLFRHRDIKRQLTEIVYLWVFFHQTLPLRLSFTHLNFFRR